jgi:hypothetical protein
MNEPKQRLVLTQDEKDSKLWRKLMKHWEDRLQILRTQNDGDKDEKATSRLRGQIAELKAMLGMDKDLPEVN